MLTKIVLVAYKFPPYSEIGAKRWAKFCKYFAIKGVSVFVVTANWKSGNKDRWLKDIIHENIHIYRVNDPWQTIKNFFPNARLKRFIENKIVDFFGLIDAAHWWSKAASALALHILKKEKINVLIATGGPFSVNYFCTKIKNDSKKITVIQDLRDPWTDDPFLYTDNFFSENNLYMKKRKYLLEKGYEEEVLNGSDGIVSVSHSLLELFKKKASNNSAKYITIYNGSDSNEKISFSDRVKKELLDNDFVNISYFGGLSGGREKQLPNFVRALSTFLKENSCNIRLNIFGKVDMRVLNLGRYPFIKVYDHKFDEELQQYLMASDIHLSINSSIYPYAFGSKVSDAFMYKKPVLLISPPGELYSLIQDNNLGFVTDGSDVENEKVLAQIAMNADKIKQNKLVSQKFNYDEFLLDSLSQKYIDFVDSFSE